MELTDFARRFLEGIEDPDERKVVEKYIVLWDEGYRKQEIKWEQYRSIALTTMNEPAKIIDLYKRRGFLE